MNDPAKCSQGGDMAIYTQPPIHSLSDPDSCSRTVSIDSAGSTRTSLQYPGDDKVAFLAITDSECHQEVRHRGETVRHSRYLGSDPMMYRISNLPLLNCPSLLVNRSNLPNLHKSLLHKQQMESSYSFSKEIGENSLYPPFDYGWQYQAPDQQSSLPTSFVDLSNSPMECIQKDNENILPSPHFYSNTNSLSMPNLFEPQISLDPAGVSPLVTSESLVTRIHDQQREVSVTPEDVKPSIDLKWNPPYFDLASEPPHIPSQDWEHDILPSSGLDLDDNWSTSPLSPVDITNHDTSHGSESQRVGLPQQTDDNFTQPFIDTNEVTTFGSNTEMLPTWNDFFDNGPMLDGGLPCNMDPTHPISDPTTPSSNVLDSQNHLYDINRVSEGVGVSLTIPNPGSLRLQNPLPNPPLQGSYATYERQKAGGYDADRKLIKWRQEGLSYREIKERGGFSEAESTLRGRYRTLTKRREDRPRKPVWRKMDVSAESISCLSLLTYL